MLVVVWWGGHRAVAKAYGKISCRERDKLALLLILLHPLHTPPHPSGVTEQVP